MANEILKDIIIKLKSAPGCSLTTLSRALPHAYQNLDSMQEYLVTEEIVTLMDWGLCEAYRGGKLISAQELRNYYQLESPETITFFISKQALMMEDAFSIEFSGHHLLSPSIFGEPKKDYRWPDVFVLMPFSDDLKIVYDYYIKTALMGYHLSVARADDFYLHGSIVGDIWSAINAAKVIIADCTGRNPNVFYEIGIAHTLGKDTILITQSIDDVPFDLRYLRAIVYEYSSEGVKDFENALNKTLGNLLKVKN